MFVFTPCINILLLEKQLVSNLLNNFLTVYGFRNLFTKFMTSKSRSHTVPNTLVLVFTSHFFRVLDPPVYTQAFKEIYFTYTDLHFLHSCELLVVLHTAHISTVGCTFTPYTVCLQMNGAVSKVNKKFISRLTRAQSTPSASATVQVSHALPAVRFSCLLRGCGASFQDGVAAGKGFLCASF